MNQQSNVFLMDCIKGMRKYPDLYFDLAIVDPPYGINATEFSNGHAPNRNKKDGYSSGPGISTTVRLKEGLKENSDKLKNRILNKSLFEWDKKVPDEEYFKELFRISRNQMIWGGNYFDLPPTRCVICWDKMQPWESFSQFELAWTSFDKPAAMVRISNTGGSNREKKIHPTQKPIKLYDWIFRKYSCEGQKVIDTHLGSGSSRIAAHRNKLNFTGYEINPVYFDDMVKRYERHVSQIRMF